LRRLYIKNRLKRKKVR